MILDKKQIELLKEAKMGLGYAHGVMGDLNAELPNNGVEISREGLDEVTTVVQLLREIEMHLHHAHGSIRNLNKDIHCDDGQEYPVPYFKEENK